jgi:hypothetical protein
MRIHVVPTVNVRPTPLVGSTVAVALRYLTFPAGSPGAAYLVAVDQPPGICAGYTIAGRRRGPAVALGRRLAALSAPEVRRMASARVQPGSARRSDGGRGELPTPPTDYPVLPDRDRGCLSRGRLPGMGGQWMPTYGSGFASAHACSNAASDSARLRTRSRDFRTHTTTKSRSDAKSLMFSVTRTRFSCRATAATSPSGRACMPQSLTCTASCPSAWSSVHVRGGNISSIRKRTR